MIIEEMLYNTIRGSNAQMGVVKKPALGTGVGGGGVIRDQANHVATKLLICMLNSQSALCSYVVSSFS